MTAGTSAAAGSSDGPDGQPRGGPSDPSGRGEPEPALGEPALAEPALGEPALGESSLGEPAIVVANTWVLSAGLTGGVFAAIVFCLLGLIFSRVDLALLAVPLALSTIWAWEHRPYPAPVTAMRATVADRPIGTELDYAVYVRPPERVDAVLLRLTTLAGTTRQLVLTPTSATDVTGRIPLLHSGRQELLRVEIRLLGPDAATATLPGGQLVVRRVVPPPFRAIGQLPLPRRLAGLTGTHESSRAGDGGEFRDIHPFTPGDRLRRIDWKATARRGRFTGDLYVRRTAALADAAVLIVMDSRDDVGEQVAEWRRNVAAAKGVSALDIAREAASSIAAGYIRSGDRVGFQDLSSRRRMISNGSGNRHLWRLLRAIEVTAPSAPFQRRRPPIVPPGALVYVLSSFLDDQAVGLAAQWKGDGHRVIAVDVLPAPQFARASRAERVAHRVVMMERTDRLRRLSAFGVELLRWPEEPGTLPREGRLRVLARARGRRP